MSMWRKALQGEDISEALTKRTKPDFSDNNMNSLEKNEEVLFSETGRNPSNPDITPDDRPETAVLPQYPAVTLTENSVGGGKSGVVVDLAKARSVHELQPGDIERYADVLRRHGPLSYGMAMDILGWGATRAGRAEAALKAAGRIRFNGMARAVLIEEGDADA